MCNRGLFRVGLLKEVGCDFNELQNMFLRQLVGLVWECDKLGLCKHGVSSSGCEIGLGWGFASLVFVIHCLVQCLLRVVGGHVLVLWLGLRS